MDFSLKIIEKVKYADLNVHDLLQNNDDDDDDDDTVYSRLESIIAAHNSNFN